MSTALVVQQPQQLQAIQTVDLHEIRGLGEMLASSGYFADAREAAQAGVKVMAGRELGIPPVASMMGINIIKGKVALGANLIASRIRAHGYEYRILDHSMTGCRIMFLSKASQGKREELGVSEFNEAEAKAAQCFSDMYKKYPKNMYFARAISNGARFYCPEIFGGAPVYTPEELGATIDENGEMVQPAAPQPTQAEVAQRRIAEERAKVASNSNEQPFDFKEMLATFAKMKTKIGEPDYRAVLRQFGLEHSNEIKSAAQAKQIWARMQEVVKLRANRQEQPAKMASGPQADWRADFKDATDKATAVLGEEAMADLLIAGGYQSFSKIPSREAGLAWWKEFVAAPLKKAKEQPKAEAVATESQEEFDARTAVLHGQQPTDIDKSDWLPDNIGSAK